MNVQGKGRHYGPPTPRLNRVKIIFYLFVIIIIIYLFFFGGGGWGVGASKHFCFLTDFEAQKQAALVVQITLSFSLQSRQPNWLRNCKHTRSKFKS